MVTFLGIPVYTWSILAFLAAVIYAFTWPKQVASQRKLTGWQWYLVRWGHTLSWVFLGLACIAWGSQENFTGIVFAILGGLVYMVFLVTLLGQGRPRN